MLGARPSRSTLYATSAERVALFSDAGAGSAAAFAACEPRGPAPGNFLRGLARPHFEGEAFVERHPEALDRCRAVGQHRLLGKRREARGVLDGTVDVPALVDDLGHHAHGVRLLGFHDPT